MTSSTIMFTTGTRRPYRKLNPATNIVYDIVQIICNGSFRDILHCGPTDIIDKYYPGITYGIYLDKKHLDKKGEERYIVEFQSKRLSKEQQADDTLVKPLTERNKSMGKIFQLIEKNCEKCNHCASKKKPFVSMG